MTRVWRRCTGDSCRLPLRSESTVPVAPIIPIKATFRALRHTLRPWFDQVYYLRHMRNLLLNIVLTFNVLLFAGPAVSVRAQAPAESDDVSGSVTISFVGNETDRRAEPEKDHETRIEQLESEIDQLRSQLSTIIEQTVEPADFQQLDSSENVNAIEQTSSYSTALQAPCQWCPQTMFSRTDEYPTVHWSGFLQLDIGWVTQDDTTSQAVGSLSSSTGLRRVRLRMQGNVREQTKYVVDLDFAAAGHPSFRDVALEFNDVPVVQNLQMGFFRQPFGMDAMTSGRELVFLERSAAFSLTPFRQTGISAFGQSEDERGSYNISAYRFPTDEFGVSMGGSGGWAFAGRVTRLLMYRDNGRKLIHIGGGYSFGDPANNTIQYDVQPSFFSTDPGREAEDESFNIVSTGPISTNTYSLFNLELAAANGPFRMQSEARWSSVSQRGGPHLLFPAAYAQMSYVFTGESHPYDRLEGIFHRVIPDCPFSVSHDGGGAVEAGVRWAYINLNDKNIVGGSLNSIGFILNWYLHRYSKFQFETDFPILNDPEFGQGHSIVWSIRSQIEF